MEKIRENPEEIFNYPVEEVRETKKKANEIYAIEGKWIVYCGSCEEILYSLRDGAWISVTNATALNLGIAEKIFLDSEIGKTLAEYDELVMDPVIHNMEKCDYPPLNLRGITSLGTTLKDYVKRVLPRLEDIAETSLTPLLTMVEAIENQTNENILKGDYPIGKFLECVAKTHEKIEEKANQDLIPVYTIGGEIMGKLARKVLEEW